MSSSLTDGLLSGRLGVTEADEVLVVRVHVGQLVVDHHHDLVLALLLLLPEEGNANADDDYGDDDKDNNMITVMMTRTIRKMTRMPYLM